MVAIQPKKRIVTKKVFINSLSMLYYLVLLFWQVESREIQEERSQYKRATGLVECDTSVLHSIHSVLCGPTTCLTHECYDLVSVSYRGCH